MCLVENRTGRALCGNMQDNLIQRLFLRLQSSLNSALMSARDDSTHPTAIGDASQISWFKMLKEYLPERYEVSQEVFVIDSEGKYSERIDLVIHDRHYSPLIFNNNGIMYIPAESIYAVMEVKQDISKNDLEYAGKKAESVRKLHRTSAPIPHAGGKFEPKPLQKIVAGFLALDSKWTPPLGKPFKGCITQLCQNENTSIDFGCVLKHGAFDISKTDGGNPNIEISFQQDSLIFFFVRLIALLQSVGTVPALDVMAYAKWIDIRP